MKNKVSRGKSATRQPFLKSEPGKQNLLGQLFEVTTDPNSLVEMQLETAWLEEQENLSELEALLDSI